MITCTNCNKEIPGDSSFCPNCGIKIEKSPNFDTTTLVEAKPTQIASKKANKIIPIAIVGLVVVIAFGFFMFKRIDNKPENTVVNFFESIQKADTEKFLDTLSSQAKNDLLYDIDWNMAELASGLFYMNQEAEYELGKDWVKLINITLVYEDANSAIVEMFLQGERETLLLIKEDGKWKIADLPW